MLQGNNFIENIDAILKAKLKELELKPLKRLSGFMNKNKRFYSTPCLSGKEKLFFKILIKNELAPIESIKREAEVINFLLIIKEKLNFSHLVKYDNKNFPYWYLSQYVGGELLGHFYELYAENKKYIPLLIDALFAIQSIPREKLEEMSRKPEFFIWDRNFDKYLKMAQDYRLGINKEIAKEIDFEKIYAFFDEKKEAFAKSPLVLAHGDYTLANFITAGGKLVVVDWEQVHLDNFAYDLSHLWIQLYRYPDWRKELVSKFISRLAKNKIEEFKDLFRVVIITEAMGELRWSINLCEKKYRKGVKESSLKTINAALAGFDNLTTL